MRWAARLRSARRNPSVPPDKIAAVGVLAVISSNTRMRKRHIRRHCAVDDDCKLLLRQATDTLGFSARAYDKILKVSRTIADLDGAGGIATRYVSAAHAPALRHTHRR